MVSEVKGTSLNWANFGSLNNADSEKQKRQLSVRLTSCSKSRKLQHKYFQNRQNYKPQITDTQNMTNAIIKAAIEATW